MAPPGFVEFVPAAPPSRPHHRAMTADDLSPRERVVFLAACNQADADDGTGKPQVIHDPEYDAECDRLTEVGVFEKVELEFADGRRAVAGYRLSEDAALIHLVQNEIEAAQRSMN